MPDNDDKKEIQEQPAAAGQAEPQKKSFFNPFVIDVIGGIGSLLAAAATAKFYVDTSVYKNMSSLGLFDKMKPARREAFHEIQKLRDAGTITTQEARDRLQGLIKNNEAKAEQLLETFGVSGWQEKLGLLRGHQKAEAAVWSMAAGSVALGSVVGIMHGLFSPEQEKALLEDKEKNGGGGAALPQA